MRFTALALFLTGLASIASATTFTVTDPYPGTACASTSCDVIGNAAQFDVQSLTINENTSGSTTNLTVTLLFNYNNGDTTLAPFTTDGVTLAVGDLLFHDSSSNIPSSTNYLYGIALNTHGGGAEASASNGGVTLGDPQVTQGTLYTTSSPTIGVGVATAQQVLGITDPNVIYRNNEPVWLRGGTVAGTSSSFNVSNVAGNPNEVQVTIGYALPTSSTFVNALNSNTLYAQFGSATCANDVLQGPLTSTPEPVSFTLMGGGLVAIALLGRRRMRK